MRRDTVEQWLRTTEVCGLDARGLLGGLAARLVEAGLPLIRLGAWVPTQHPELWGSQVIWTPARGAEVIQRPHDASATVTYQGTPGEAMHTHKKTIRCRLEVSREELAFPVLAEIADLGGTDYLMVPTGLPTWVAFTINRPGGFTAEEIGGLESLCSLLTVHIQLATARDSTRSLLEVYLGPNAARRVMAGEFLRGSGTSIDAAIWFCDMRGFTNLSDRLPPGEVVGILDEYFECVAGPIEDHGGEILKLIGDAALAIFPVGEAGPAEPCRRALAAAEGALASLAAWRSAPGRPDLRLGVALHLGEVLYGNIGGRRRLDFTVIGATVNEVCRVESLCKPLGSPLLMTSSFGRVLEREDLVSLGHHALKGVSAPQELFTLAPFLPGEN